MLVLNNIFYVSFPFSTLNTEPGHRLITEPGHRVSFQASTEGTSRAWTHGGSSENGKTVLSELGTVIDSGIVVSGYDV